MYEGIPLSRRLALQQAILKLPNLVAYYPLNETEGTVARNYARTNRGSLNGTISGATLNQSGKVGRAYSFDGVNDKITISDDNVLDLTNTFTFHALINPTSLGPSNGGRILSKENGDGLAYDFLMGPTNGFRVFLNNTLYNSTTSIIVIGTWQQIVATFDKDAASNQIKFYSNGATAGVATRTTAITGNSGNLRIGDNAAGTRVFDGLMQHVFMSSGVLSQEKILKLAQIANLA